MKGKAKRRPSREALDSINEERGLTARHTVYQLPQVEESGTGERIDLPRLRLGNGCRRYVWDAKEEGRCNGHSVTSIWSTRWVGSAACLSACIHNHCGFCGSR
jgi:hypothetical protein